MQYSRRFLRLSAIRRLRDFGPKICTKAIANAQKDIANELKTIGNGQLELKGKRTAFILSSTKGNIEENISLADSAQRIANQLGIDAKPIVVCNACISGLSALILGNRLIDSDLYDAAIVCGCDTPRQFILSGFQSLKALSPEPCRPFDMERMGLNLGEAAATLILSKNPIQGNSWRMGMVSSEMTLSISAPHPRLQMVCICPSKELWNPSRKRFHPLANR